MRFLTGLSSRLNSRSAHEVMVTLDIYLAGGAHLFDNLRESAARFIPAFMRTGKVMPAGLMAVLSAIGAVMAIVAWIKK